jgi:hypothetical protein
LRREMEQSFGNVADREQMIDQFAVCTAAWF